MEGSFTDAASGMESEVSGAAASMEKSTSGASASAQRDASKMEGAFGEAGADMEESLGGVNAAAERDAQAMRSSFQRASSRMAGDVDDSAEDAERSLGGISDAAKTAGAVIGGALAVDAMVGTFDDSARAAGRLQARLGLTAEEAEQFDEVAKEVYRNNFGESMVDAADSVGLVHQALGLQGKQLQARTEDILGLSDAFEDQGADVQIITEAVRAMKQSFPGMSDKQILDQIAHSFQQGAGTAGDLQDTLQEYPPHFKALGLTSKDMFAFFNTGMENGARNTDFLGDAIKEFGIRVKTAGDTGQKALHRMFPKSEAKRLVKDFAAGGEAGRDAFFKLMRQLSETDSEQRRYNLAVELFGTKAEDMVGVLDKMTPAFLATKNAQDESQGAAEDLGAQYTGIQAKMEGLKRFIQTTFVGGMGEAAGAAVEFSGNAGVALLGLSTVLGEGGLTGAFGKAKDAVKAFGKVLMANPYILIAAATIAIGVLIFKNWDKIVAFLDATWGKIKSGISVAWGAIKDFFEKFWPVLLVVFTGGAGLLVLAVIKHWDKIRDATAKAWDAIKSAVEWAVDKVIWYFEHFTLPGLILSHWKDIRDTTVRFWNAIRDAITGKIQAAKKTVESTVRAVVRWLSGRWTAIKQTAETGWNAIKDRIVNPIRGAKKAVEVAIGGVAEWLSGRWTAIKQTAETGWNAIKDRIVNPIRGAKKAVEVAIGGVAEWLSDKWDAITERVASFGTTVRRKVVGAFRGVANAVIGFVNAIIGAVNHIPGVEIGKLDKLRAGGSAAKAGASSVEGFATGGELARKGGEVTQPTIITGEEAPTHPEWVIPENPAYRPRALGLLAAAAARLGAGVTGLRKGGTTDRKGGPLDALSDAAGGLVDIVTEGPGFILDQLPSPGDFLPDWLQGMGKSLIGSVTGWVKDQIESVLGGLLPGGEGSGLLHGAIVQIASAFGLDETSGHRPGDDGWHGQDRAKDFSNSSGPTPQMLAFAELMLQMAPKLLELIYTPLGKAVKNGAIVPPYAAADHYDHVHVAMAEGGLLGGLPYLGAYEAGGILPADGIYYGHEGERVTRAGAEPVVELHFADGMGWLRDFVDVRVREKDRDDHGRHLQGVRG